MAGRIGIFLAAIFVWCAMSGCVKLYVYYPIDVKVTDAESGDALAAAKVSVSYPTKFVANPPKSSHEVTDAGGQARLWAATTGQYWSTRADGYLEENFSRMPGEGWKPDDGVLKIHIYKEPAPTITVVVGDDYRGPLLIERLADDGTKTEIGKREFRFEANERGYVAIRKSALLTEKTKMNIVRTNGTMLEKYSVWDYGPDKNAERVGVRETCACMDDHEVMAIGTRADYERVRAEADAGKLKLRAMFELAKTGRER